MLHLGRKSDEDKRQIQREKPEKRILRAVVYIRADFDEAREEPCAAALLGQKARQINRIKLSRGDNERGDREEHGKAADGAHEFIVVF